MMILKEDFFYEAYDRVTGGGADTDEKNSWYEVWDKYYE